MKLTLLLIASNVLIFFYSLTNFEYFITNYGFSVSNFLAGRYHVIVTSIFLHANLSHLIGNMVALFFLGWTIEKNTENWQYLSVYFLSGVVGNISFFMPFVGYTKGVVGIGASAAISGLVGLGIFVCPSKFVVFPSLVPLPFVLAGALYFLATLSNLFIPSEIAHPAHLFGLATGAVFGLAWGENRVKRLFIFIFLVLLILALPYIIRYVFRRIV